jgi:hypothetical protein
MDEQDSYLIRLEESFVWTADRTFRHHSIEAGSLPLKNLFSLVQIG